MKDCYEVLIFKVYIMTAVRLPRLSRPGVIESIDPKRLFELLHPYADFFANRSVPIETPDQIDCQAVIREITKADRETPADLLDAICLIDELANTVAIELLLDRMPAHTLGIQPVVNIPPQISLQRLGWPILKSLSKHTHFLESSVFARTTISKRVKPLLQSS